MKTIEEQAREYAMEHMGCRCPTELEINHPECRGCYLAARDDFKAGYKAATRWISVKEGLPPMDSMCAISHASSPNPLTAKYVGDGAFCSVESGMLVFKATHWLPVPPIPEK